MPPTSRRVALFTVVFLSLFAGRADAQEPPLTVPADRGLVQVARGLDDVADDVTDTGIHRADDLIRGVTSEVTDGLTGMVVDLATTDGPTSGSAPVGGVDPADPIGHPLDPATAGGGPVARTPGPAIEGRAADSPGREPVRPGSGPDTVEGRASSGLTGRSPADLVGDDLANFQLPLVMAVALAAFLVVEGRIGRQPGKLVGARVATRRPLPFR